MNTHTLAPRLPDQPVTVKRLGVWLWLGGTLALLVMSAAILGWHPDVEAVRVFIRATARTSLLSFLLAYMASTWQVRWPSALSRSLLAHRRSVGLVFVSSHLLHAAGIVTLAVMADPSLFARLTPLASRVIGGLGYVAVLAMAVTSSDPAMRWLGTRGWQALHRWGGHLIWLVFFLSMAKRAPGSPWHGVVAALLLALLTLKLRCSRGPHRP